MTLYASYRLPSHKRDSTSLLVTCGAEVLDTIYERVKATKGNAGLEIDLGLTLLLYISLQFHRDGEVSLHNPKAWASTSFL